MPIKIMAQIPNTRTLRGSYVGSLADLPSYTNLRDSTQARQQNPVQLIAGSTGVRLNVVNDERRVVLGVRGTASDVRFAELTARPSFKFDSVPPGSVDAAKHLLSVGAGAELINTEQLAGLYRVNAEVGNGNTIDRAVWFVHFVQITVIDPPEFTSSEAAYQIETQEWRPHNINVMSNGRLEAKVAIKAGNGVRFDEIHTGFIQNFIDIEHRLFGRYESSSTVQFDPQRTMLEWIPEAIGPGPYIDSEQDDDWNELDSAEDFPFVGTPVKGATDAIRTLTIDDSPGAAFPIFLDANLEGVSATDPNSIANKDYWVLRSINGQDKFMVGIAARTKDAPYTFLVFYRTTWRLKVRLSFVRPTPQANFATVYQAPRLLAPNTLNNISTEFLGNKSLSRPMDANLAGFELFGPNATGVDEDEVHPPRDNKWLNFWLPLDW